MTSTPDNAPDAPAAGPSAVSLTRPSEVRALLARLDFKPSKVLGQNFLIDGNILNILVDSAEIAPQDTVLEIGPGLGVLTERLLEKAARVIAVEKDQRLCAWLRERFQQESRLQLHEGDALDQHHGELMREGVSRIVANLPYSVGSRLLMTWFETPPRPVKIVVTVQLEVAERIAARPGTKDYGLLTIWTQMFYEAALRKVVSASCFFPPPQIKSAVVVLTRRDQPLAPLPDLKAFRTLVKTAFSQRRKQLGGILLRPPFNLEPDRMAGLLAQHGIKPETRPEEIEVATWGLLSQALVK